MRGTHDRLNLTEPLGPAALDSRLRGNDVGGVGAIDFPDYAALRAAPSGLQEARIPGWGIQGVVVSGCRFSMSRWMRVASDWWSTAEFRRSTFDISVTT